MSPEEEAAVLEQLVDILTADRADFAGNSAVGSKVSQRDAPYSRFCTSEEGERTSRSRPWTADTKSGNVGI
jgi:hypothetical protein